SRYAYGISVNDDFLGHRLLQHGGEMEGYLALLAAAPDDDWGIVILANSDHATTFPAEAYTHPTSLLFLKAVLICLRTPGDPFESTVLPDDEWSKFTGNYFEQFTYGSLSVTQKGDALWFHIADPDPRDVQLEPYSSNTFTCARSYETVYQSSI